MSVIAKGTEDVKTVTFPSTVRAVGGGAFSGTFEKIRALESVILNEGLVKLGGFRDKNNSHFRGVFSCTKIKQITFPSTLRVLGDNTFLYCK